MNDMKIEYKLDSDAQCLTFCPHHKKFWSLGNVIRRVGSWGCWTCEHCDREATDREKGNVVHCLYPDCYDGEIGGTVVPPSDFQ